MIMRQRVIGIVTAVVLAAVGTALLVAYVRGAEHRAASGDRQSVLVVTDPIAKGTRAEDISRKVRAERIPDDAVAKGAITSTGSLVGEVALVDLVPGEQLLSSRFAPAAKAGTAVVPPGMFQVTVVLDAVRAMGGQVREGDSVGVLASFDDPETTHLVLHKVAVTGVRSDGGVPVTGRAQDAGPAGKLFVTLALDGPSVERVVFAAEHGRLWLSAEPKDANEGGTKVQTKAAVNA